MPPRIPDSEFNFDMDSLGGVSGDENVTASADDADKVSPKEAETIKQLFEEEMVFNGVTEDGEYGIKPMTSEELAARIQGKRYYEGLAEKRQLQRELTREQPALRDLRDSQLSILLTELTDARKNLILNLSRERAKQFVTLIDKPWRYDRLVNAQQGVFETEDLFQRLYQGQDALYDAEIQAQKAKLLEDLSPVQCAMIEAMLEEQWDLFEEEKNQGVLEQKKEQPYPVKEGVDPTNLAEAGWAVIFPAAMAPQRLEAIKEALSELLVHRRKQVCGSDDGICPLLKIYEGEQGYQFGESKAKFLQRHRVGAGVADPDEMPFYVLLVGSPEEIPYEFQYQLDVMRGVGRLDFVNPSDGSDDLDAYAQYAHNVVLSESGTLKLPRKAAFFAVENPGDQATRLSSRYLIQPLLKEESLKAPDPDDDALTWDLTSYIGAGKANRSQLKHLLGGDPAQTPTLLFTASHGMEFTYDPDKPGSAEKQFKYQGALLCQDWPGPNGKLQREHYFAAEDLDPETNLLGMITFFFACYGAGTPREDQFETQAFKRRKEISPYNFIGALPKQLLRHGALAVLGHVERAWGYSFVSPIGSLENLAFVTALQKLLRGEPVGLATDPSFNLRYADMSSELSSDLQNPSQVNPKELAQKWTASNDARGYVVLGDPAVRIPFAQPGEKPTERPSLEMPAATAFVAEEKKSTPSAAEEHPIGKRSAAVAAVNFGLRDQVSGLTGSLRKFTDQLADALEKAATDITTLEVKTYTTDDLTAITTQSEGNARLRARTHIDFDGDIKVFVPERAEGGVDQALWAIHQDMVREAQANRAQFLQAMAEMATNLLKNLT